MQGVDVTPMMTSLPQQMDHKPLNSRLELYPSKIDGFHKNHTQKFQQNLKQQ